LKKFRRKGSLADPTALPPPNKDSRTIQIFIETPKGSRNKYAFDPDLKVSSAMRSCLLGCLFHLTLALCPQPKPKMAIRSTLLP
jgi:inorganic pyrophosphatase